MREEAEFEVVSGCAEGLVSKTDCVLRVMSEKRYRSLD
jgi:hypothetical protein